MTLCLMKYVSKFEKKNGNIIFDYYNILYIFIFISAEEPMEIS